MRADGRLTDAFLLSFDDFVFKDIDEFKDIVPLRVADREAVEGRGNVAGEQRPIALANSHPFVRNLHVASGEYMGPPDMLQR